MDVLLTLYRSSLLAYLRNRFTLTAEDAEDLLHNFVHHKVLQSNLFAAADRTQGRFRSYLFAVLRNYATSEIRRLNAR
jgi:DNA-directed RNA polymerase specialized sigma24 family protein